MFIGKISVQGDVIWGTACVETVRELSSGNCPSGKCPSETDLAKIAFPTTVS